MKDEHLEKIGREVARRLQGMEILTPRQIFRLVAFGYLAALDVVQEHRPQAYAMEPSDEIPQRIELEAVIMGDRLLTFPPMEDKKGPSPWQA